MVILPKSLLSDQTGMATYEFIVNNEENLEDLMNLLIENLRKVDTTGQFLASSARFLNAMDPDRYAEWIPVLIEGAIERDKDRKYIWSLLEAIWGEDYMDNSVELQQTDDNFRRIFKRLYPGEALGSTGHLI